jgi:hypothetical protein
MKDVSGVLREDLEQGWGFLESNGVSENLGHRKPSFREFCTLGRWVNKGVKGYTLWKGTRRTRGGEEVSIRVYAQVVGVVLILVGIVGLLLGDQVILGILNTDIVEDIVHLITGGLLAYIGFGRMDVATARNLVLALGVIYLLVGILGFVVPMMFGLIPHGYTLFDDLLHLALGVLSLAVAFFYAPGGARTARS